MSETVGPEAKQPQVETLLSEVFKLMDYPAKLDFKDMADGSLGVAVHFEGELPGITAAKRSHLVDCVQFWLNKVVNRPNVTRRWVNLGVNAFPEPRGTGPAAAAAPAAATPRASAPPTPGPAAKPLAKSTKPLTPAPSAPPRRNHNDERSLTPAADPAISAAGKLLAEKSAKLGRLYGVMGLTADQRALMLKAAEGIAGVSAKAEGEGHWRRLVMTPDKLTVITKQLLMPDDEDEDE